MAFLKKMEENCEYSGERVTLSFAASAATASSMAVVRQAMTGDPRGAKWNP